MAQQQTDFLKIAGEELRTLKTRDSHLASTEKGIKRERDALRNKIARISEAIDTYRELTDELTGPPPKEQFPLVPADLGQMTIADACAALLRTQPGGQADTQRLVQTLQEAGKLNRNQGSYGTLVKTLSRTPDRFYKVQRGRWGLVEFRHKEESPTVLQAPMPLRQVL